MNHARLIIGALCLSAAYPAGAQTAGQRPAAAAPVQMAGIWDLVWITRKGPQKNGYLVVTQSADRITAQIHGQGSVRASGSVAGSRFALRGKRMAVPYIISGAVQGDRLEGSLRILSVERHFTGTRRR